MLYWPIFTLLFAMLLSPTGYAQPALPWVEIGFQDYNMHPVLWEPMARAGDPQAQFNVGLAHAQGDRGYKQDHQKALHWLTLSAEQGYPAAENNLAIFYALGHGIPLDHSKARYWFKRASAHRRVGVGYENLERIDRIIAGVEQDWRPPMAGSWEPAAGASPVTPNNAAKEQPKTMTTQPIDTPRDTQRLVTPIPRKKPVTEIPIPKRNPVIERPQPEEKPVIPAKADVTEVLDDNELSACAFAPTHFTLQLVGSSSREKITKYVRDGNWQDTIGYVHTQRDGKDWFVVIYGNYPDRETAAQAKQQLKTKSPKLNPWLRSFASLHQYCSNQASK